MWSRSGGSQAPVPGCLMAPGRHPGTSSSSAAPLHNLINILQLIARITEPQHNSVQLLATGN